MQQKTVDGQKEWPFIAAVVLGLTGFIVIMLGFGLPMGGLLVVLGTACVTAIMPAFAGRARLTAAVLVAGAMLAVLLAPGIIADHTDELYGPRSPGAAPPADAGESYTMKCTAVRAAGSAEWTLTCVP